MDIDSGSLTPSDQLATTRRAIFPGESEAYASARQALLAEEIDLRRHLAKIAEDEELVIDRKHAAGAPQAGDMIVAAQIGQLDTQLGDDAAVLLNRDPRRGRQCRAPAPI